MNNKSQSIVDYIQRSWREFIQPKNSIFDNGDVYHTTPVERIWFKKIFTKPDGTTFDPEFYQRKLWIPVPFPCLVPGINFEEMYYHDQLSAILGVYQSDDRDVRALGKSTADNIIFFINQLGFMPNANMVPYITRSQPPVLPQLVKMVYENHHWKNETEKQNWLQGAVSAMEIEYDFWMRRRFDEETGLNHYDDDLFNEYAVEETLSRLRSFVQIDISDPRFIQAAKGETDPDRAMQIILMQDDQYKDRTFDSRSLRNIERDAIRGRRAACESGIDYSTRWLISDTHTYGRCHEILAVDLNALLAAYEQTMGDFLEILGQDRTLWDKRYVRRQEAIQEYLWNESEGTFMDYDLRNQRSTGFHALTNFVPMWAGIASPEQAAAMLEYLNKFEIEHGLMISLDTDSKWQWDGMAGWGQHTLFVTEGLMRYGYQEEGKRIMRKWVNSVQAFFYAHGFLIEKIDLSDPTKIPANRYETDRGFGWTNGSTSYFIKQLSE